MAGPRVVAAAAVVEEETAVISAVVATVVALSVGVRAVAFAYLLGCELAKTALSHSFLGPRGHACAKFFRR